MEARQFSSLDFSVLSVSSVPLWLVFSGGSVWMTGCGKGLGRWRLWIIMSTRRISGGTRSRWTSFAGRSRRRASRRSGRRISQTLVGYQWMVRELARLLGCGAGRKRRARGTEWDGCAPRYHRLLADAANLGACYADDLFAFGQCYDDRCMGGADRATRRARAAHRDMRRAGVRRRAKRWTTRSTG